MTRPRGRPPTPSAMSRPSEPVEMVSISTAFWFLPSRMIEPLPKARSICARAASSALVLSTEVPSTRRRLAWLTGQFLLAQAGREAQWAACGPMAGAALGSPGCRQAIVPDLFRRKFFFCSDYHLTNRAKIGIKSKQANGINDSTKPLVPSEIGGGIPTIEIGPDCLEASGGADFMTLLERLDPSIEGVTWDALPYYDREFYRACVRDFLARLA